MSFQLSIHSMVADDPASLFAACASQGWDKPLTLFERYCQEQKQAHAMYSLPNTPGSSPDT